MVSKTGRILVAFLSCMISLALPVTAQESTYSANSLMAAFEEGSKASLKGALITFRDVVVENKNSKLIFRSSETYKVICDLAGSAAVGRPPSVGSQITVIGKVRGRGMLGNVTLDNCNLALAAASTVLTQPARPEPVEPARPSPDTISKKDSTAASLPKLSEEPRKPEEPRKEVETPSVRPAKP